MNCRRQAALAVVALLAAGLMGCDRVYQAKSFHAKSSNGREINLPYRLMVPESLESGKRYPLVLFLHGAGQRGSDNSLQLESLPTWLASGENRRRYPCFVLAPQCPDDMTWSDLLRNDSRLFADMTPSLEAVVDLLNAVIKHNPVDPARVYLTGLSMGGYGSWELAERMPERFAAVAPICGGGDETKADRLALPHLGLARRCRHGGACGALAADDRGHRAAGGKPKYTELPGVGHDSWTPAYHGPDNLLAWLFAQTKPDSGKSPWRLAAGADVPHARIHPSLTFQRSDAGGRCEV